MGSITYQTAKKNYVRALCHMLNVTRARFPLKSAVTARLVYAGGVIDPEDRAGTVVGYTDADPLLVSVRLADGLQVWVSGDRLTPTAEGV